MRTRFTCLAHRSKVESCKRDTGISRFEKGPPTRCGDVAQQGTRVQISLTFNSFKSTWSDINEAGMATSKANNLDILLARGWKQSNIYGWSPFCTKLELRFRLSGIKYRCEAGSPPSGPMAKLPYVTISSTSSPPYKLGDTALIARDFINNGLMEDLNGALDETSRTLDLAIQALVEDRLYFFTTRERWTGENYWVQRDEVLGALPWLVRVFVGNLVYRKINCALYGQGAGRFSDDQAKDFREGVWMRLDALLRESRKRRKGMGEEECFWCLGGEEPTECDTSVFGAVCAVLVAKRYVNGQL